MTVKRLKSLLSVSFLTISVLTSLLSFGQTSTATFRQKINQELPTNNAKAITAAKLRAVFSASANAIDSIATTFSLADNIGEYDASTGIAKVTATGATSTPGTTPAFANGKYFDVVKAGTRSITGVPVAMVEGGKIIVRGTAWGYIPPSDAGLRKALALELKLPSRNLANPSEFVDGELVQGDNGNTVANASYGHTGFISVTPGLAYSGKGSGANGMRHVAFYNASKVFVTGGYTANTISFTVPAGVYYVIGTYYIADKSTFQLEQAASPTSFVAYGTAVLSNTVVAPTLVTTDATHRFATDTEKTLWNGKLDQSQVVLTTAPSGKNLFNPTNVVLNSFIVTSSGAFNGSGGTGWIRTGPIACTASTNYTISGLISRNSKAVRFEDASGTFVGFQAPPGTVTGTTMLITTPAGAAKMYITLQRNDETIDLNAVQVELGSSATAFEAYTETSIFKSILGHDLVKADVGLSKVNNTSDAEKPISTAQQAALNLKLNSSEIVSQTVGVSKNLANPATFTDGAYLENNGIPSTNAAYGYTDFIPVTAGLTYSGHDGVNPMRKTTYYNSSMVLVAGGSTVNVTSFTVPAGVAYVRVSYYLVRKSTFQFEQAASPTTFVPYNPGTLTLISVAGAAVPSNPSQLKRTVGIQDCERLYFLGDSYSVGYNALPGKNYISTLSMFTDWNVDNFSKSGDATNMILARLVSNTPQYKGVAPKSLKGGGFAVIISFTNDVNNSVINSTDQLNTYLSNIRLLAEAAKGMGYRPIVATEYHNSTGNNGTGLLQAAVSQFCEENGYIFMDVFEKTRYLKGATNFSYFWEGSHPGMRTNAIFWANMLPYVNSLPRPRWSIKVYRKRDFVTVSSVNDLMYVTNLDRAKKFKEILVSGQALNTASYNKYDDQGTWTPTGNTVEVGEYYDLLTGSTIAMPDYSLMEVVINSTPEKTSRLDIKVGSVDAVYVKNHITQTWTSLPINSGIVSLSDLAAQIDYDKVSLLVVKSGGWNMAAPSVDFYGLEGKNYYLRAQARELRSSELVTTRNFNSGTTGWTVTGTITPAAPEDNASLPTGITQVATISSGNYVSQAVTFTSATYKRRGQLKVIARRNPPRYLSSNTFPTGSPITLDSYDFANVKVNIVKGSNTVTFRNVVGMHWTEAVYEFDIAAGDTSLTISIQKDDQDFELADLSFKVE